MNEQENKLGKLVSLLEQHAPAEGIHETRLKDDVITFRMSTTYAKTPTAHEPALVIIGQGKKNCYVGDQKYNYSAGNLLTVLLPMPLETELVEATPEKPFLAAGVRIDLSRMADILLRIERAESTPANPVAGDPSGIFSVPLRDGLLDPVIRLLEALSDPTDASILGELIIDEIYYRLLSSERGGELRFLLQQRGEILRISRAVEHIHENLEQPVSVENLADMVHMSRTSFYETFRDVLHVSPLQYAKSVKLHKAQTLIREGKNASEAGYRVGYNSPAQFSREYKRQFGFAPSLT